MVANPYCQGCGTKRGLSPIVLRAKSGGIANLSGTPETVYPAILE
jgi:hypothetical protein